MRFEDIFIFKSERFSVGQELDSGKYYLAIPVSNGLVEYEEQYKLAQDEFERFSAALTEMRELAEQSRARQLDSRLMMTPGRLRGSPI
jgi:hypothetical protein